MVNKYKKFNLQRKLSVRLLLLMILCGAVFTVLVTSIQLYTVYQKGIDDLHETLEVIGQAYAPSVALNAFKMNTKHLEVELEGMLAFRDIVYVELKESIDGVDVLNVSAGALGDSNDIIHQFYLSSYIAASQGILRVVAEKQGVYDRVFESALSVLAINALKLIPLSICIFLLLQYMVIRHVSALAAYGRRLSTEKLEEPFFLKRKKGKEDELAELVKAMNYARIGLPEEFHDIESYKESLRKEKNLILTTLSCISEGVIATDLQGNVQFVNSVAENILRLQQEQVLGEPIDKIYGVVNEKTKERVENSISIFLETGKLNKDNGSCLLINKDGEEIPLEESTALIRNDKKELLGVVLTFRDVSNRNKNHLSLVKKQQELYKSQEILKDIQKAAHIGSWEWMLEKDEVIWSEEMYELLEISKEAFIPSASYVTSLVHPDDREGVQKLYQHPKRSGAAFYMEVRAVMPSDKSTKYLSITAKWEFDAFGKPIKLIGTTQDITAQKVLKNRLEAVVAAIPDIVLTMDEEGLYVDVFSAHEELLIVEPKKLVGKYVRELFPEKQQNIILSNLKRSIQKNRNQIFEYDLDLSQGKMWFEARCAPIQLFNKGKQLLVMIVKDITDRVLLETQLRQAQKMEAIGTLAGGIAHDFNNILTPISGYTEIALEEIPKESSTYELLCEVLSAAHRAKELTQQILTFSRQNPKSHQPLKVQPVIKEALKLISSAIPSTIKIEADIAPNAPMVMGDPTHIHQIIINLCTNAYHAMRETGGTLDVVLNKVQFKTQNKSSQKKHVPPGTYLQLLVSDTGVGIKPELIDRIFDPYFTTKKQDEGTGMGLSIVHGIVKGYGGELYAQSQPGIKTCFEVLLPCLDENVRGTDIEQKDVSTGVPKGSEHILVVDDDPVVIKLIQKMLIKLGYQVTAESDSRKALEMFRAQADQYDLMITDMTMPHMTGDEFSKKILEIKSNFPIIICTGYSEKLTSNEAKKMGVKEFIMKPLSRKELALSVRKILDEG